MHKLEPIELNRDLGHAASKLIVTKNLRSNKRAISVKEREAKLDLKQSLPTTAESCNAKRTEFKVTDDTSKRSGHKLESNYDAF